MFVFSCACVFSGYEGENCEVDIDECEQHPCENGGECFQRSDILNYGMLPELSTANFSYEEAAGFICHCLPGFIGEPVHNKKPFSFLVYDMNLINMFCLQETTAHLMWTSVSLLHVRMEVAVRIWSTLINACVQTASQVGETSYLLFYSYLLKRQN